MRKYSTRGIFASRMLSVLILSALLVFFGNVSAQCPSACGASTWGEAWGIQYPITNNDLSVTVGSGTFTAVQLSAGGTYTFSTCGSSNWADTYITGFQPGSSACLFYNDNNGPACTGNRASVSYAANVDNLINVQVDRKIGGVCTGWTGDNVSGTLTYRCTPPSTPAVSSFGNQQWNVYVWNAGDAAGAGAWGTTPNSYSGYLTDGALSFNSTNHWGVNGSPSDAPSYQGCYVGADGHSWSAMRRNFTCGIYQISIPTHDDACELYINGTLIAAGSHVGCCDSHNNIWQGVLNSSSTVEFRVSEGGGGSVGEITISPVATSLLSAGIINSSQTICTGGDPNNLINTASATGGVAPYTYDWASRDNNCTGAAITGLGSGLTYDPPAGLTTTTCFYRTVTDACGNDITSAPVTITVLADHTANTPTLNNNPICVGGNSTASVTYSGGVGSATYSWEYSPNNSTWSAVTNNTPAGATYSNTTSANLGVNGITAAGTYYYRSIVTLSGSGCGGAFSPSVALSVVADPTLPTATVSVPTICAGGSTNITSAVSGGTGTTLYQWEYDNGGTWVAVSSGLPTGAVYINANTATLNVSGITAAGTYNYRNTVSTTGSGCNAVQGGQGTLTVVADPSAGVPVFTNSAICVGGSTQVSTTVSGGTGSFGYQWQYFNGSTWNNVVNNTPAGATYTNATALNMTIAGISSAGSYQYRVVVSATGSGCDAGTSAPSTLTVNPDPTISISGAQTYCGSGSTTLSATVGGGAVGTLIQWESSPDNITFTPISGANGNTYTTPVVTSTTYYRATYTSTGDGCNSATSNVITLTIQPGITNNTINPYQKFCLNGDPVVITAGAVSGGNGTYTYAWEQSTNGGISWSPASGTNNQPTYDPPFTSSTIRYRRIVTSGVCSSTSNEALMLVLPLPQVTGVTPNNVLCFGTSTGSINVTGSTQNGSVYYSNNGGSTYQVSGNFPGLPIGSYNIYVRDDSSCVNSYVGNAVVLTQPTDVTHTTTSADASCSGVFDGQISISAAGGVTPYRYSLNGGPTQSGSTFLGLASGTYLVSVFDNNGCVDTSSVTINNSYAVNGSILAQTNVSCFGGSDGAVTVQLTGGISPYVYSLNGGAFVSSQTFTGLPANLYVVTLRDSKGCTDFLSVNITQPAQLAVTIDVVNNVLCNGDASGEIFISVNGGTPGYTYNWSNGRTTQDIMNVGVGTYLLTVTDSKNCVTYASASVSQPLPLTVTVAQTQNLRCFNDNSGRIDISVNGGVPPYTYAWSNGASTEDIINLGAGTYTATVTDGNGCIKTTTVTITQPAALTTTISGNTISCNGGSTGIVDLTVNGGTPNYTYLWSNGYTSQDLAGVPAGIYNVIVTDANNCTTSNSYNVAQPGSLTLSTLIVNVNCYGDSTGSVNLSVSGGVTPYTFNWSNGASTQSIVNIPAGNYNVSVVDNNGCTVTASAIVTQPNQGLATTLVETNVTCNGANNGSANLSVSGGTLPYNFAWSNGATSEDLTNVGPNTYYVTVTDFKGCVIRDTAVITQPAVLNATIASTNVTCYGGNNGAIDLTITGGNPGYTYLWSPFATTQDLNNLTAGTYNVVVTDTKGCQTIAGVAITQPAQIVLTAAVTNVNCNGAGNGAINLTVAGGVGPFTYSWNSGAFTTEDLTSLTPGTYTVLVTDFNGCTATATYSITQPAALNLTGIVTDVTCNGAGNGAVNINVTGGVTPYTYAWSNGAVSEDLNALSGGTYDVTVTDANGCTIDANFVVQEPIALTASIAATNVTCYGGTNGAIDLTVTGGNPGYTYLWSPFATTQDLNNIGAGSYNVVITDSKGCQTITGVTITQPAQIVLTAAVTNVNCNGAGNGAINLTVAGGVGPFTYSWNSGAFTTEDLTSLNPGTYSVLVTDFNGCTATATYNITQPAALNLTGIVTDVTCNGAGNGAVNINVTGGVTPYTYAWSNGAVTEDLTALSGGIYDVTVTDANGCTIDANFVVQEPIALTASIAGTNVFCYGGNNGAANLTVNGGNPPYSFLWSNFASTEDLTNLTAGNYTVIVTDSKGCQTITGVTITQPAQIVITAVVTNISCNGSGTGAIDITVTGGTGTLSYSWNSGAYTTEDLSNLAPGTYTVVVTDANFCTASATYNITQPLPLASSGVVGNVSCFGGANGSINFTVNGGNSPFTFNWSNGATTEDLNGLTAGTYDVTATDANGCTATNSFTVTQPTAITSAVVGTNVTCYGASNGAANLTVSGGVTPYTYLWNTFQNTEDLTGLQDGTYYVIITDGNGCTKRDSVIITEPTQLVLTSNNTNILCNGAATGAIDLSITGGTGAYTFAWSNGATTEDLSGLAAGTYTATATDGNGCTATRTVTLTQPAGLVLNATPTNVTCAGGANGRVDITVNGGVFPYTFAWSNGTTTEDANGLSGGPISVTVTDANGCTISQSFNITEPTPLVTSIVGTNVTCYGASNGAANLTVSGGVTPYTYLWNNFQATEDLSNIAGGTYYIVVTDANGCTKRDSVIITEPAQLVLTSNNTNVLCNGAATGAIDLSVTGGTGTYTYLWNTGATTQDISGIAAGTYGVQVTDANGCADTLIVTITQPTALVMNATTVNVACNGGGNGQIDITVNGGVFPYTFAWSNGATTEDVNSLSGGPISVTVTDANGCTISQSFNISEPSPLFSVLVGTNVTCYGASNGTTDLAVGGGTPPYTYLWNNFQSTEDLSNLSGGTYFVIITDANGCTKRDSIVITEPAQLILSSNNTNILCNGAATGGIDLSVTGGTGAYSYVWSNGATSQDLSGVAAGTYTVTVTDGNGCTATRTVTLTQPAGLVLNATPTNVTCAGGANGRVDITVNGGVFPYTFAWSNGTTTEDANGLSGGPISVTVTDANGCTISQSYNISEPTPLVTSIVGTNVTCYGASNGAANLTVSGGVVPYTYLWNNFQATEDLNNIAGGTYYVIVTDANGCNKRDSVIITEPTQLQLSTVVTNVLCNGDATGAINLTVTGGTVNYTFAWSNGATTEDVSGLVVGTYTVTVTDANGCTATTSVTVTSPNALVATGVVHNVFCAGGNDGNINLSVTGGAQPYAFAWSNGAVTEDILNLTQGTYSVTVTDQNGCTTTATFNVTEPTGITSSVVGTDVACQGANNGAANLTVSGGTPPYTFFWSNFQNTEDISGLDGGIYYVIITDANGCTRRDSVYINEPSPLILSYTSVNVSCFNANDGSIDLTVVGGISSYTYIWSNGATTQDLSNLAGNTYSVTVTDNNGCTATTSVLIINPSPLSANFITTNPSCYLGNNGAIDLLPTGGTPNYSFSWNNGANTEDLNGLANGLYIVTITDSRNCTLVDSVNIVEPAPLVTAGFIKHVSCFGKSDGFIDITAYGGTVPYVYNWSTGNTTEDIGGLPGGNYTITTTDFNNCTVASLYVVNEPTALTLGLTGTNISCFEGTDGTAAALPSGGTTPYSYLWDDFATDSARTGLEAGKHAVLLTDSNGCTAVDSIVLSQPVDITILGLTTNVTCANGTNGGIDLTIGGGTPVYSFNWTGGATTEDLAAVGDGTYAVQVTDANGCVKAASFTITEPKAINTQLLTDQPSCYSSKNGSASVIASEGVAPYTFVWSTTPAQTTNTANFIGAGTYTVTVTDANSCSVSASVNIVQPDSIAVSTTAQASRCFNTATGAVFAGVVGGEAPYIYSLNGVTQLGDTFVGLAPGNYILEVTDLNGCSGTSIFTIAEASQITVDLVSSETVILTGMETQLVANSNSTTPIIAHYWTPDSVVNFNGCSDTTNCSTPYAAPKSTTLYTVTVMNADSCTASDTITIYVTRDLAAFMPTVFTPNGDGLNDRFEFDVLGAKTLDIKVFDRWGGLVYSNENQTNGITGTNGWDGTRDGKPAAPDTYVYHLNITYFDGNATKTTGTITLMR